MFQCYGVSVIASSSRQPKHEFVIALTTLVKTNHSPLIVTVGELAGRWSGGGGDGGVGGVA